MYIHTYQSLSHSTYMCCYPTMNPMSSVEVGLCLHIEMKCQCCALFDNLVALHFLFFFSGWGLKKAKHHAYSLLLLWRLLQLLFTQFYFPYHHCNDTIELSQRCVLSPMLQPGLITDIIVNVANFVARVYTHTLAHTHRHINVSAVDTVITGAVVILSCNVIVVTQAWEWMN